MAIQSVKIRYVLATLVNVQRTILVPVALEHPNEEPVIQP